MIGNSQEYNFDSTALGYPALDQSSAQSEEQNGGSKLAKMLNQDIDLTPVNDVLYMPTPWKEEMAAQPLIATVTEYLKRLSPTALITSWVVTSGTRDLSGATRNDSRSHSSGKALDIAPMFDADTLLPENVPMMGLAWNIKSLILLSEGQWGDIPVFVEGDHLHFGLDIKPDATGCLPIMWSDSDFYPSMRAQNEDVILSSLRNSFWRWRTDLLKLESPSPELSKYISSLLDSDHSADQATQ